MREEDLKKQIEEYIGKQILCITEEELFLFKKGEFYTLEEIVVGDIQYAITFGFDGEPLIINGVNLGVNHKTYMSKTYFEFLDHFRLITPTELRQEKIDSILDD